MYHSTPCITAKHSECKEAACTCICHPKKAIKKETNSRLLKLKVFKLVAYAPIDWPNAKYEEWLETEGLDIERQLKNLAFRMQTRGVEIKLEEDKLYERKTEI